MERVPSDSFCAITEATALAYSEAFLSRTQGINDILEQWRGRECSLEGFAWRDCSIAHFSRNTLVRGQVEADCEDATAQDEASAEVGDTEKHLYGTVLWDGPVSDSI